MSFKINNNLKDFFSIKNNIITYNFIDRKRDENKNITIDDRFIFDNFFKTIEYLKKFNCDHSKYTPIEMIKQIKANDESSHTLVYCSNCNKSFIP